MRPLGRTMVPALLGSLALVSLAYAGSTDEVTICHFPPGNPDNYQTITISTSALPAHLAHGDFPVPCDSPALSACDCILDCGGADLKFSTATCGIISAADCKLPTPCDDPCREFLATSPAAEGCDSVVSSDVVDCFPATCGPQ
jgi:hypothetical protein